MSFEAAVHAKAIELDLLSLEMTAAAGSGHPTSAMSLGHIVTVLMYMEMRWSPEHPLYPTSDRLVLSEGHAVPIVYAACADLGVAIGRDDSTRRTMTTADAMELRALDSVVDGHPNPMEGFPFFDAATGSLGQGLSVAAGLAVAARQDEIDKKIYCIIGDGESREGQIWEAVDLIVEQDLAQVVPIFNCNEFGQSERVSSQQSAEVLKAKLEAAGCVVSSIDGHDPAQIRQALQKDTGGSVHAIVARTVKGWGAPSLQGGGWHGKPASGMRLEQARNELAETREGLTTSLTSDDSFMISPPAEDAGEIPEATACPTFSEAMRAYDMEAALATGRLATRKGAGLALRAIGHAEPRLHVLDADVKNSTFSEWFANDHDLASRFTECRIAEQNMVSMAAGLSAAGKIPVVLTFSKFFTRAYDQIEMAINSGANLKLIGSHSGISLAADGPSQMSLPDVSWFRSFATMRDHHGGPGCYILQPADGYAAYALGQRMMEHNGACYMRTHRPDVELLYDDGTTFELGGFNELTRGRDLLIISAGYMIHECNKALEGLDKAGVDASLVDLYSLPFDEEALLDLANENGGNILVVEDNYGGGIGSAVSDACTASGDPFTINQMFVRRIPKSGRTPEEVLRYCGLNHEEIAATAASMVGLSV
ncbi:MAG: transketolase [Phycisphaerales bacterium]|nr:transketolase [Phycisphaerales bacterium]